MTPTPDTKCARCGHARRLHEPGWCQGLHGLDGPWYSMTRCRCLSFVEPDATETIVIW